ncbi:MAG: hypothetical protein U9N86_10335 [Bacteroidota bacterium]|nr:hypothetical protein [Bacteroidota bacterium]
MSIDKLKRIIWRLREQYGDERVYKLKDVRKAIMYEVGIDDRTLSKYTKKLKEAGLIERISRWYLKDIAGMI